MTDPKKDEDPGSAHPPGKLLPSDVDDGDETSPEDDLQAQDHPTPPGKEDEGRAA